MIKKYILIIFCLIIPILLLLSLLNDLFILWREAHELHFQGNQGNINNIKFELDNIKEKIKYLIPLLFFALLSYPALVDLFFNNKENDSHQKNDNEQNDIINVVENNNILEKTNALLDFIKNNANSLPLSILTHEEFKLNKLKKEIQDNYANKELLNDNIFMENFNKKSMKIIHETNKTIEKYLTLENELIKDKKIKKVDNINEI